MPVCPAPKLWWSGAAPLAKLAFTDLGSGTTGSLDGLSYLNLTKDYYPWPYVRSAWVFPQLLCAWHTLQCAAVMRIKDICAMTASACVACRP